MKIGVVGVGAVGSATARTFEILGHEVSRCDLGKGYDEDPTGDVIFVCIWDSGDMTNVCKVVDQWQDSCHVMAIKTTLLPGITDHLIHMYGNHICFCPEFLTEATAQADSMEPDKIIIGAVGTKPLLDELFDPFCCDKTYMSPVEAEILKLALNAHHALKVTFANEIADICERYSADYAAVREGMEQDRYVTPHHLDIDHGGYRGYGGKCLPKDTQMLINAALAQGYVPALLAETQRSNALRRNDMLR